jgi:hypothetical protein
VTAQAAQAARPADQGYWAAPAAQAAKQVQVAVRGGIVEQAVRVVVRLLLATQVRAVRVVAVAITQSIQFTQVVAVLDYMVKDAAAPPEH